MKNPFIPLFLYFAGGVYLLLGLAVTFFGFEPSADVVRAAAMFGFGLVLILAGARQGDKL